MIVSIFVSFVFAVIVYKIIFWYIEFSSLRKKVNVIPGPKDWPLLGNAPELSRSFRKRELTTLMFQEYPKKYGPLFRLWFGVIPRIMVCNAEYAEPVLTSTRILKKSVDYELVRDWLGDGLLLATGDKWRNRRKLLTPTFHFSIIEDFLPIFVECADNFVAALRHRNGVERPFDIYSLASLAALDAVCECAMGVKLRAQSEESEYVKAVKRLTSIANERMVEPWYASDFVFYLSPKGRQQSHLLKIVHSFTRNVISEKRKKLEEYVKSNEALKPDDSERKKRAFLDLLVSPEFQLFDRDVEEEVDTFMFEGHDTTGAGIAWCLYEFGLNPTIQEQAYEEVMSVLSQNGDVINMKSLQEMKYLECCIKEGQRLHPSVPFIAREATEDFRIGEYVIPKGSQISIFIMTIHLNPEVYPDPMKFDPDRFFIDEVSKRHPYAYVPFSAGPRNCIGQRFAVIEMKAVVADVLKNFKIKSCRPLAAKPMWELILKPEIGLFVELEDRYSKKR